MGLVEGGGTIPDPPSLSKWVILELWSNTAPVLVRRECKLASPCLSVLICEMGLSIPCFSAAVKIECIGGGLGAQRLLPKLEGTTGAVPCSAMGVASPCSLPPTQRAEG